MNNIDVFIEYAGGLDPRWPARIRGANRDDVEALEQLVGRPLPPLYRAFLLRLGEEDGRLKICEDAQTQLTDLLEYYRSSPDEPPVELPPDSIVIAAYGVAIQEVSLCPAAGSPDGMAVHMTDGGTIRERISDSFAHLLYQIAFQKLFIQRQPALVAYSRNRVPPLIAEVAKLASELDFTPQWFCDSTTYAGQRGPAAVSAFQLAGEYITLSVTAPTEEDAEKLGQSFATRLGLQRH